MATAIGVSAAASGRGAAGGAYSGRGGCMTTGAGGIGAAVVVALATLLAGDGTCSGCSASGGSGGGAAELEEGGRAGRASPALLRPSAEPCAAPLPPDAALTTCSGCFRASGSTSVDAARRAATAHGAGLTGDIARIAGRAAGSLDLTALYSAAKQQNQVGQRCAAASWARCRALNMM